MEHLSSRSVAFVMFSTVILAIMFIKPIRKLPSLEPTDTSQNKQGDDILTLARPSKRLIYFKTN